MLSLLISLFVRAMLTLSYLIACLTKEFIRDEVQHQVQKEPICQSGFVRQDKKRTTYEIQGKVLK